jgi:hypothetical protein
MKAELTTLTRTAADQNIEINAAVTQDFSEGNHGRWLR